MSQIRIEAFLSEQPNPAGNSLRQLVKEIGQEYGDKVEIIVHKGRDKSYEEFNLSALPALLIGDFIRFIGVCPDKGTLVCALRESGLE